MKRKVEFTVTTETKKTEMVEFPVYNRHVIYNEPRDTEIYRRWDADDQIWVITIAYRPDLEIELERETEPSLGLSRSNRDYVLGLGEYHCNPWEFDAAVEKARNWLEGVSAPAELKKETP